MLRIFAAIAPATASSRSASSKTMNGALPPSSIEVRRTFSAHCSSSTLADLRGAGERQLAGQPGPDQRLHHGAGVCTQVTQLTTPCGQAGLGRMSAKRQHRQRGLVGGLDDARAAGRDGGADLAGAHRHREVPRRDRAGTGRPAAGSPGSGRRRRAPSGSRRRCARPRRRSGGRTRRRRRSRRVASASGLPISSVISRARSSMRSCSSSKARVRMSARSRGAVAGEARLRARRPRRGPVGRRPGAASATAHSASPVDGSRTSKVAPPAASTHVPPMRSCRGAAETTADSSSVSAQWLVCSSQLLGDPRCSCNTLIVDNATRGDRWPSCPRS